MELPAWYEPPPSDPALCKAWGDRSFDAIMARGSSHDDALRLVLPAWFRTPDSMRLLERIEILKRGAKAKADKVRLAEIEAEIAKEIAWLWANPDALKILNDPDATPLTVIGPIDLPPWYEVPPSGDDAAAYKRWYDRTRFFDGKAFLAKCPSWFNQKPNGRNIDRADLLCSAAAKGGAPTDGLLQRVLDWGFRVSGGPRRDEAALARMDAEITRELQWLASADARLALGKDLSGPSMRALAALPVPDAAQSR